MGNCYSVRMRISDSDCEACHRLLSDYIARTDGKTSDWSLGKWASEEGLRPDTLDHAIRMLLAGWSGCPFRIVRNGRLSEYSNSFNASYGWEGVLQDAFTAMLPALGSDSELLIDVDEGAYRMIVSDGKLRIEDIR